MSENGHRRLDSGEPHVDPSTRPFKDAERVAEEWGEKAVRWLAGTIERAREEAEDIWAEAQEKRRQL
jgi:hypothetical protein